MDNSLFKAIIESSDTSKYLSLDESQKEDFMITLMYDYLINKPLTEMNVVQKTLFLAMKLEDTCQADSLPSLSEDEEIFMSLSEIASAYERLGAPETAQCLKEFISLLPKGSVPEWDWFFAEERNKTIRALDTKISSYPDGPMSRLYIKYLSENENTVLLFDNLH